MVVDRRLAKQSGALAGAIYGWVVASGAAQDVSAILLASSVPATARARSRWLLVRVRLALISFIISSRPDLGQRTA